MIPRCAACGSREVQLLAPESAKCNICGHTQPPGAAAVSPEVVHVGGGYYDVLVNGTAANADRIRGKTAAAKFARSLT